WVQPPTRARCSRARAPHSARRSVRTVAAETEDLDGVGDIAEAMLVGDVDRPALHLFALHLDGAPAAAADQMMMMSGAAAPVERLSVIAAERIQQTAIGEHLEIAVDRRQSDGLAALTEHIVDLLST